MAGGREEGVMVWYDMAMTKVIAIEWSGKED